MPNKPMIFEDDDYQLHEHINKACLCRSFFIQIVCNSRSFEQDNLNFITVIGVICRLLVAQLVDLDIMRLKIN
ncbi:hypothetical protein BCT73_17950 [Vibrio breoganii]|nr:hypothetical protein BCT73_17950 [Vibrio breoganii]PMO80002.1 hypothetical protein BCT00_15510 [Vibrio breoganii]